MTRSVALLAAALLLGAAGPALAQPIEALSCQDLWYERNSHYKQGGYCFRTPRAIRAFGNAGCQYDRIEDVPLTDYDRGLIRQLAREEARRGCPR